MVYIESKSNANKKYQESFEEYPLLKVVSYNAFGILSKIRLKTAPKIKIIVKRLSLKSLILSNESINLSTYHRIAIDIYHKYQIVYE